MKKEIKERKNVFLPKILKKNLNGSKIEKKRFKNKYEETRKINTVEPG